MYEPHFFGLISNLFLSSFLTDLISHSVGSPHFYSHHHGILCTNIIYHHQKVFPSVYCSGFHTGNLFWCGAGFLSSCWNFFYCCTSRGRKCQRSLKYNVSSHNQSFLSKDSFWSQNCIVKLRFTCFSLSQIWPPYDQGVWLAESGFVLKIALLAKSYT